MRIMINGVGYDTFTSEFDVFATIKKSVLPSFEDGYNGIFNFSNQTIGAFYTFVNKKGIRMLRVHGVARCKTFELETYLIARRADVTTFMNSLLK